MGIDGSCKSVELPYWPGIWSAHDSVMRVRALNGVFFFFFFVGIRISGEAQLVEIGAKANSIAL